jgi:molybdopterin-guanine dinucleotide biosynthesis protein A
MTPPLHGLVLAGGRSTRMGQEKGLIDYRGKAHRDWLADLLQGACARVFLALNAAQAAGQTLQHDVIVDDPRYETSPMGALLSAHAAHASASWVLLSCDLAYFDAVCLNRLLAARDVTCAGTAFCIPELDQPEPLATIYEAAFVKTLPDVYAAGERSLRRALARAGAVLLAPEGRCAESVDTPEAAAAARRELGRA